MYDWISKNRWVYLAAVPIIFAICIALFYAFGVRNAHAHKDLATAGSYGDSFGFANALFSSLALAGVVIALFVQTLEFGLAAKERGEGLESQKAISHTQRQATQVQAIGLRMEVESGKGFRPADMHTDSIAYERLIREANYKFELDTIISELFQKEPPNRDVFTRRLKLAGLLVEAAWALVEFPKNEPHKIINRLQDAVSQPSLHSLLIDKFLLLNFEQVIIADQTPNRMDDVFGGYKNQAYCKLTREAILVLGFSVLSDAPT